jgi:SP family general alpha glucoside:H+ symporter-like MFS transporter
MPYVIQWVWPIPLFVATLFAPESELHHVDVWTRAEGTGPWWLVRKDRTDQAKKSLRKLARSDYMDEQTIDAHIALIAHTIELERAETEGGGWKDLFRGTNRRRTEIVILPLVTRRTIWRLPMLIWTQACVVWSAQYCCGQPISNFATELWVHSSFADGPLLIVPYPCSLQTAGMGQEGAFDLNVANFVMIFFGTVVAWLCTCWHTPPYCWEGNTDIAQSSTASAAGSCTSWEPSQWLHCSWSSAFSDVSLGLPIPRWASELL